jgi:hypothetical protein
MKIVHPYNEHLLIIILKPSGLKNKTYDEGGKIYLQISRSEELVKYDFNFEKGENDFRDKWGIRGNY